VLNILILYHVTLAAGDLVGIYLILSGSPAGSYIKNKGYHTYYKV